MLFFSINISFKRRNFAIHNWGEDKLIVHCLIPDISHQMSIITNSSCCPFSSSLYICMAEQVMAFTSVPCQQQYRELKPERERGQQAVYYTSPQRLIITFSYSLALQLWGLLMDFISWFIKLCVQAFQPLILINRGGNHWGCTTIYRLLSYPFISLVKLKTIHFYPRRTIRYNNLSSLNRNFKQDFVYIYKCCVEFSLQHPKKFL